MKQILTSLILLISTITMSQSIDSTHVTYRNTLASLDILKGLLAIPNDAHYPEDIEKNVVWCEEVLDVFDFKTQRLETTTVPLLLATPWKLDPNKKTMLFYFHIDGQPVDSTFWFQENPYHAVLKEERTGQGWEIIDWENLFSGKINPEWRIFARSSSDDKSPFVMFLAALGAIESQGLRLAFNLKVILDFEEEIGSPRLATTVIEHKESLESDMLVIFDGPKHPSNKPTISFGARGITSMTLKVFGPTFPLHSGHYGNYAPNPALRLSKLLSGMKDDFGRVTIPGYYDGISLDSKTRTILQEVPDNEREIRAKLGIGSIDSVGTNYQEALQYPSLNIRGMSSAWTGTEVRTIVPATATAELDLRLVVESDGERLKQLVRNYINDKGYLILDRKPTSRERFLNPKICQISERGVTNAFRTDFDSPLGVWAYKTLKRTFGEVPVRYRTMGGTLPTSPFISTLGVPALIIPLVNSDNNQHSPNENLRVGNYFNGSKAIYELLLSPID